MDDLKKSKHERSKAKQVVTIAAKRLSSSIFRDSELHILEGLMADLEKAYNEFIEVNEELELLVSPDGMDEHRVVNGEDLPQYRQSVQSTYEEATTIFLKAKKANAFIALQKKANPVRTTLRRNTAKMQDLFKDIDEQLYSSPDGTSLKVDKDEMTSLLNAITEDMEKLQLIFETEEECHELKDADVVVEKTNKKLREVTVTLRRLESRTPVTDSRTSDMTVPKSSFTELLPPIGSAPWISTPRMRTNYSSTSVTSISTAPHMTSRFQTSVIDAPSYHDMFSSPMQPTTTVGPLGTTFTAFEPFTPHPLHATYGILDPDPHQRISSGYGNQNVQHTARDEIRLKKMALPTFSGERKDWPEFKAVWRALAEQSYHNKTALAHELKQSVQGEASQRIKSVYITRPQAYDLMWEKLEAYYDDVSASVQAALSGLEKLKPVQDDDFRAIVRLIDEVEATYSQLQELKQLSTLTMRDVDQVTLLLPKNIRYEWIRKYHDLPPGDKVNPFNSFMNFLNREREAVVRLAEAQTTGTRGKERPDFGQKGLKDRKLVSTHQGSGKQNNQGKNQVSTRKFYPCACHQKDGIKHVTEDCTVFQKLPLDGKGGKYDVLKQIRACFICFEDHQRVNCPNRKPCPSCGNNEHRHLLCKQRDTTNAVGNSASSSNHANFAAVGKVADRNTLALYPIQQAVVAGTGKKATVFCDSGYNTTYIVHKAADRLHARKLGKYALDVTTMGNVERTYNTRQYELCVQTQTGRKVNIIAFGMDTITGPVSKLDTKVLASLFPEYDVNLLQRQQSTVDILLGCDYFGLHPKHEIAQAGDNLSIMRGEFGVCLQGSHPDLKEQTQLNTNLAKTVHNLRHVESFHVNLSSHSEFITPSYCPAEVKVSSITEELTEITDTKLTPVKRHEDLQDQVTVNTVHTLTSKNCEGQLKNFILGEELATEITLRCGGCRCGKCPTVGHTYSFKEEQELHLIQDNLEYDDEKKCWITSYPCLIDPKTLPDNYGIALSTLRNTERTLLIDKEWATTYATQMQDMLERQVARKLTDEELQTWEGPRYYICHLAVVNPKSNSTPVRVLFNSSQICHGVSLNKCLAKGPDCYLNNLVGLLLRWREESYAVVGDIKKMFNSIHLKQLEQHCHRFLWRDLDQSKDPSIYVMVRVNMGDTPAPAISTEAIYKTADLFREDSPQAAQLLRKSSYVDDLIDSFETKAEALKVTEEAEDMLYKGGFAVKCWQFSGEAGTRDSSKSETLQQEEQTQMLLKGTDDHVRVLVIGWKFEQDVLVYQVNLNFSKKRKGIRVGPKLTVEEVPSSIPSVLTRRMVLEQVMGIYDPLGLLCPFTLLAKIYLRETWMLKLDWDDPIPDGLRSKWLQFFKDLFEVEDLQLDRKLHPAHAVGGPWLIILCDGSNVAYGFAAYILWKLKDGTHWCRLIMAKCRIAPVSKLSTPQLELNAAVLSKRGRDVIEKEMRFKFERIYHLVDSETVLNMINKTSTRFKVYEGVRVGEIQSATLARFRQQYWVPHGDKLAKSVKNNCQLCKLREPKLLQQAMGLLPHARLKPSPPFSHTMIDLFGPYSVRGEVQKRTSGKAYGVIFTDLTMRAVHIEAVFSYDTSSFLMALSRFASVRGWPEVLYSDPGSQLIGAEKELKIAWESMDTDTLKRNGAVNGLTWIFGPADSPWYQGAVESLVKGAKRAIDYAIHNQRLSVPEFQTVCYEVANLLNERPIGSQPSEDSDLTILTPNSLLLGRATAKNPGGWQPQSSIQSRYRLVQTVTDNFWRKWVELYAPTLVVQPKWRTSYRNLWPGDVVIIADRNTLRGEYRLGIVKEVFPGDDGKVRQVVLSYKNFKVGEKIYNYSGAKDVLIRRSVQRLALLVPVDSKS